MNAEGAVAVGLVDLAARRLGGMVLAANDEFFAAKENLLDPLPPAYDPHRYSDRGKEMDGWETRRRRTPGHDWCLVRLGVPGVVRAAVVDTSHFRGNYPAACSLDGAAVEGFDDPDALADATWFPLVPRRPLEGDRVHRFDAASGWRVTHVRLNIYPDGGVARLRLYGEPLVPLRALVGAGGRLDLAATTSGGVAIGCSDAFFCSPSNLIAVGDARDMADGWETRRRRGPGHDWAAIRLAAEGIVERVEVDTTHFKGNHPDRAAVDACALPPGEDPGDEAAWREIVPPARLRPHARHVFETAGEQPATHVRLRILPDGGVARLRVFGRVSDGGWLTSGLRHLNALPPPDAERVLAACCGSRAWVAAMLRRRPFAAPEALLDASDAVWRGLDRDDWLEAFDAHPRIGERAPASERSGRWSQGEQAGARGADDATMDALEQGNRSYEERFGHVFLIRAAGRSAAEMLDALRERLGNDPAAELRVAAEEQRQITRRRLEALLREGADG